LHDRDAKFSGPFDEVSRTEEVRVIRTPIRPPNAERFVRTVRSECLDHVLDYGLGRLGRPPCLRNPSHVTAAASGLDLATPADMHAPPTESPRGTRVARKDALGDLIRECRWAA
jgi:hypothetical protein